MNLRYCAAALFAGAIIAACAGGTSSGPAAALPAVGHKKSGSSPIQHVIVVIQENRSFDNLFATFPGADGAVSGNAEAMPTPIASACSSKGQLVVTQATTVPLTEVSLTGEGFPTSPPTGPPFGWDNDLNHIYSGYKTELDGGKMDGFDVMYFGPNGSGAQAACTYPYQYVNPNDIAPYWDLAQQYVLADHMFQTQGSSSFTAHQDLIAGATAINKRESIIDNPDAFPWGCDSPPGSKAGLITTSGKYEPFTGPHPCYKYETLRDVLDAAKVSWKYYAVKVAGGSAGIWNAFDAIEAVRHGPEWRTNIDTSPKDIFNDISNNRLPAVSWLTPDAYNSDHPDEKSGGKPVDYGPSWVASVVNAIGQSKYWDSCAIIVLWDDSGGFYDHEPPAFFDEQGGLGFRVPMMIISPYVQPHVDHTQYEDASILKFIEQNFKLGSLPATPDARATSIGDAFNLTQTPRPFQVISSQYHRAYFLHQKPSDLPVDSE